MISTLDFLYVVLALCSITITVVLVLVGTECIKIMRDVRNISHNVEQIMSMVQRLSGFIFPGLERVARKADTAVEGVEDTITHFMNRFGGRKEDGAKRSKK